jgi:hypothetical protein
MPYIGNVTTSSNVNGSQINNGTITGDKLSLPFDYDSATLYLDNTNNRVGILTASPSSTLTVGTGGVVSIPLASAATPSLVFGTDTNTGIYSPGADQVAISTNGTGRLFVDASGNVGVGGTPTARFTVVGSAGSVQFPSDGATLNFTRDAANYIQAAGAGATLSYRSPVHVFTGASLANEFMRLDSSGRLGVGSSSPGYQLEVSSGATDATALFNSTAANGSHVRFGRSGTVDGYFGCATGFLTSGTIAGDIGIRSQGALVLGSGGNNNRLFITSAGLVGIGTSAPGYQLHVVTSAVSGRQTLSNISRTTSNWVRITNPEYSTDASVGVLLRVFPDSDARQGAGILASGGSNNNSTELDLFYTDTSGTSLSGLKINSSGNVGIGTTAATEGRLTVQAVDDTVTGGIALRGYNVGSANGERTVFITALSQGGSYWANAHYSSWQHIFSTNGSEKARLTSDGKLLVGTSTARALTYSTPRFQVEGSGFASAHAQIFSTSNNAEGAYLTLGHSRGTTWELLQNNDTLGRIDFVAGDGVDDVHAGEIRCAVDGTPGSNDMPTRLVFSTTADGAASPTERLRITSAGNVGIGTTGPAAALHVVAGGTAAYFISNASSAGVSIGSDTNLGKIGTNGSTCNLAFNIDGAEKARIDTSGRFLVGTSSLSANVSAAFRGNSFGAGVNSRHLHDAMDAANPVSGQTLGVIDFTDSNEGIGVEIAAIADANWGAGDYPGRLVFSTTADGASSPTERFRIS